MSPMKKVIARFSFEENGRRVARERGMEYEFNPTLHTWDVYTHEPDPEPVQPGIVDDELSPKAQAIEAAKFESNIDGYGDEGAGYDMEKFAILLEQYGWEWKGEPE